MQMNDDDDFFDFFLWGSINPILYASAMMHDVQDCK